MKRCIRVECWADYYFFGRLLSKKGLIRKEKNKSEVIKSIKERAKGEFSVGIVDSDNDAIEPFIKGLVIEKKIFVCDEIEVIKIKGQPYFIIQLHPKEFEKWIVKFIEINCNKKLIDFGYNNYDEFESDTKVIIEKLENNERFKNLVKFILNECPISDNHINRLKKTLDYLVDKNYAADINELKNV